jgi:hypothetical protein
MGTYTELSRHIQEHLENPKATKQAEEVVGRGLNSLAVLGEFLRQDLPIDRTERLEVLLKAILREAMSQPVSGPDARKIARFQKELGFLLKYKSYAIKAATPVGYSIFLQNEREGFSFQRHVEHKLEVFHILSVKPGGYIFLCDFQDWQRAYEKGSIDRWLAGESNPAYDRFKFVPDPGDVFIISELGVVHTVVGCVLEEFATVSTDMVDRLHDQNVGKKIPPDFTRPEAEPALRAIEPPRRNRLIHGVEYRRMERLDPVPVHAGERVTLCDSFVRAARCLIAPGQETVLTHDEERAVLLRMHSGHGTIAVADVSETTAPRLRFERGDLFLIPPGIQFAIRNENTDFVSYSEHCIAPGVAFI